MKNNKSFRIPFYIITLFVICLVTLASTAVSNYQLLQALKSNNDWIDHTWTVKDQLKTIDVLIMDAESSLRGYFISNNPAYLGPWNTARKRLPAEFEILGKLIQDDQNQVHNQIQLRALYDTKMQQFEESLALFKVGGLTDVASMAKIDAGREVMDEIRMQDVIMEKEELELLTTRRDRFFRDYDRAMWTDILTNALAILILTLFYRLINSSFVKQRKVEDQLKLTNDSLESTVLMRTQQLSVLSRHLLSVAEEEKAKLARELHDELGSSLTAISMDISSVIEKLSKDDPALANQLGRAKKTLLETVDLKRRIIEDLRPSMLDNLGLAASIRHLCEEISRIAGFQVEVDMTEDFDHIDPTWAIALYRITQESLNNTIKYAQATEVKITLKRRLDGLWLQILDDGIGISKSALGKSKTHGLLGMRERTLLLNGNFAVYKGENNRGCAIEAFIPFSA